jgi:hypothetical protein
LAKYLSNSTSDFNSQDKEFNVTVKGNDIVFQEGFVYHEDFREGRWHTQTVGGKVIPNIVPFSRFMYDIASVYDPESEDVLTWKIKDSKSYLDGYNFERIVVSVKPYAIDRKHEQLTLNGTVKPRTY